MILVDLYGAFACTGKDDKKESELRWCAHHSGMYQSCISNYNYEMSEKPQAASIQCLNESIEHFMMADTLYYSIVLLLDWLKLHTFGQCTDSG